MFGSCYLAIEYVTLPLNQPFLVWLYLGNVGEQGRQAVGGKHAHVTIIRKPSDPMPNSAVANRPKK